MGVVARGIGPSLTAVGISGALPDPILELHNSGGGLIQANDNWQDDPEQAAEISARQRAPASPVESALVANLPPGPYTAILAGKNGGTGVALVEIYRLPDTTP